MSPFKPKIDKKAVPKDLIEEGVLSLFQFANAEKQQQRTGSLWEKKPLPPRTTPKYPDFVQLMKKPTINNEFITLTTQLTENREEVLQMIYDVWPGPIVAVVACDFKDGRPEWDKDSFVQKNNRNNTKIILFNTNNIQMAHYPINYLRNLAWDEVQTPFVFLLDVDFVPRYVVSDCTYNLKQRYIHELDNRSSITSLHQFP